MAHKGRLHINRQVYLVQDLFRHGISMLVPDPEQVHTQHELDLVAARRAQYAHHLSAAVMRWRARVHAHCWLRDRALLLVQVRYAPLEWIMHSVRSSFSQYIQEQMHVSRPHRRYQALLLDADFFWDAARYVLNRPHLDGLCTDPVTCDWSSAPACLGSGTPPFLAGSALIRLAPHRGINTPGGLSRFLREEPPAGFSLLMAHGSLADARVLGRPDFVRKIHHLDAREQRPVALPLPIIEWVAERLGISSDDIVNLPRSRRAVVARALVAWLVSCSGAAPVATVARWFKAPHRSALERSIAEHSRNNHLFSDALLDDFRKFLLTQPRQPDPESGDESTTPNDE